MKGNMEINQSNVLFIALLKELKQKNIIHFVKHKNEYKVFNNTHAFPFVVEVLQNGSLKFDFVKFGQSVDMTDLKKFVDYYRIFKFPSYIYLHFPKYFSNNNQLNFSLDC